MSMSEADIRKTAKMIREKIVSGKKKTPKIVKQQVFSPVDYEGDAMPLVRNENKQVRDNNNVRLNDPPAVAREPVLRADGPPVAREPAQRIPEPRNDEQMLIEKLVNPQASTELMKQTRMAQLGISKLAKKNASQKNMYALVDDLTGVAGASVKLVKTLSERLKAYASAFEQINTDIWRLAESADSENERKSVKAIQTLADQIMKDSIVNLEISLTSAGKYIPDKDRDDLDRFVKTMKQIHNESRESLRNIE